MIKLSKESRYTFFSLLVIPLIWIGLNHFGYLDYLKVKSVDLRKQFRGELPQNLGDNSLEFVKVEGNRTLPKIPKVTYVNFDAATLAMDGVGERPWDRAFFRDTAMTLLEKGGARSIAFDFGFTPKSMSRMVPPENSFRSDFAMGELVEQFPNQVVLGCLYSGVQTRFVKPSNVSAMPPFFYEGFRSDGENFAYPEAPTYPLINFKNGNYMGRLGSFSVPPFRALDEIPRWVPLWYPGGGKAHAYNLLGGKKEALKFELFNQNQVEILNQKKNYELLVNKKERLLADIAKATTDLAGWTEKKEVINQRTEMYQGVLTQLQGLEEEVNTLKGTLEAAPALATTLNTQIANRQKQISHWCYQVFMMKGSGEDQFYSVDQLKNEFAELEEAIGNFRITLQANPTLSAIVKPQLEKRIIRRDQLNEWIEAMNLEITDADLSKAYKLLTDEVLAMNKQQEPVFSQFAQSASVLSEMREKHSTLEEVIKECEVLLSRLQGDAETELVEVNSTLRLVYKQLPGEGNSSSMLVNSLPNEVPLHNHERIYTLGVEALLAYYGIGDEQVEISPARDKMTLYSLSGERIIEVPLEEDQWIEVNWFSSWTELSTTDELNRLAKKYYAEENFEAYLSLMPDFFRLTLNRVDGIDLKGNESLLETMKNLGIEADLIIIAEKLLQKPFRADQEVPSYNQCRAVIEGISYYIIPPSVQSAFNPMCGMNKVLEYGNNMEEVESNILGIKEFISNISKVLGDEKYENLQREDPDLLLEDSKYQTYSRALRENQQNLALKEKELSVIKSVLATFKDSIVLIGPEEATFQDLAPTPFDKSPVPKVSVHGNLIKTLTHQEFLHRLPVKVDHLATLVVCILMALLAVYQGKRASLVQAGGILLLVLYVYFGFETFAQSHVIWPVTAPFCAGLSTSFIGLAAMVVIEQKAKGRLKGMFGSYVSSDLVEQMVASGEEPSLGGEETEITAFFSDVQAFSSFSELLTPTGLVDLMNEYLTAMTNILQEERGTLDKYIGDAIVAMYGAPIPMKDHAYQAVRTSILMQQKQIELRQKWVPEIEKWGKCHGLVTQMQTRIGCNTGTATVGNMGALDRFNYTMMGDMVNLAARCESGAKAYGAYIMVTEETKLASVKTKDDIAFRYLDKIVVKGRSQPVAMFEPTGFMSELTQETQDCLDCFQQGIDKYLAQDWDGALNLFEKAKELEPNKPDVTPGVKDNPSMILIDRCKVMKENPPGNDWDGVYVMTTK